MTDNKTHKSVYSVGKSGAWKDLQGDIVVTVGSTTGYAVADNSYHGVNIPPGTILLMTDVVGEYEAKVLFNESLYKVNTSKLFYIEPGDDLKDQRICITGKLEHARDYYSTLITYKKGFFKKSVTRSVDILVTGKHVGQTKLSKARRFGIDIISEKEFMKLAGLSSV